MHQIPYTKLPNTSNTDFYLPLAKVRLGYKKTHKITPVPIAALIDSGADVCFCMDYIGLWLGVNLQKIKQNAVFTAANSTKFITKPEILTIYAYGKQYDCEFYFTDVLPKHTPIILGQVGFFNHFKIAFDYQNKLMNIE